MRILRQYCCLCGIGLLSACAKEPPPITVPEFMDNPRLLEATMVRCGQNRAEMKYEVECVNARDAVNRLEKRQKDAQRAELDALSERKRQALRRTQEAAAEARRRADETQKQRETAEYLGVPGNQVAEGAVSAPPPANTPPPAQGNVPGVQIEPPEPKTPQETTPEPPPEVGNDIQSIRDELQRRQQDQPQ